MQNGNSSNSQQKPINLSELSFADLAKLRQQKAADKEPVPKEKIEEPTEATTEEPVSIEESIV